jgi:hypothetical protein
MNRWIPAAAALLGYAPTLGHADEPARAARPAVEAFLLTGDESRNPGDPGTAKLTTVLSLYSLSAASLAVGTVFGAQALSARSDANDFRAEQPRGFCADPVADACVRYEQMRADQNALARSAGLFIGTGALLFIGGAAAAHLWPNEAPRAVAVVPSLAPGEVALLLRAPL